MPGTVSGLRLRFFDALEMMMVMAMMMKGEIAVGHPGPFPIQDGDGVSDRLPSPPPPGCATQLCRCRGHVTSCYGRGVVTYLPALPPDTREASFFEFSLPSVTSQTLANLSGQPLEGLSLVDSAIANIEPQALSPFAKLSSLNLSYNSVPEAKLALLFGNLSHLPLTAVTLKGMNLRSVQKLLSSLAVFPLNTLEFDQNRMRNVSLEVFSQHTTLKYLSFHKCLINEVMWANIPNLTTLDMGDNRLKDIPPFCGKGSELFPELRTLKLNGNDITHIDRKNYQCLSLLEFFDLGSNNIDCLPTNTFADMPSLQTVNVNNLGRHIHIHPCAFNNSNLQNIALHNVFSEPHVQQLAEDAFYGCDGLKYLNLDSNCLSEVSPDHLKRMFSPLKSLRTLRLQRCDFFHLPSFLRTLKNLTTLYLSHNELETLQPSILSEMRSLKKLNVSHNRLSVDEHELIPRKMQDSLETVSFMSNDILCTCGILWLKNWIKRNTTTFDHLDDYHCSPPMTSTRLVDFHITYEACLLSQTTRQMVVAMTSLILLLVVVLPLVRRYRWDLEYLLFILRYNALQRQRQQQQQRQRHFRYDAFVIYDSAEHEWVVRHLMPALEDREGLRLCLHERDFLAGKLIVDNIVDSIAASRKVIPIVSEGLATSEWCQFELSLTHSLVLEQGRDLMVVVMLEEVARAHVTPTMYAVLKTTTYISWPDEERAREAFWERLAEAVHAS